MVSRDELEGYLDGLDFPLKKDDVVVRIRQQPFIDDETRRLVVRIPDITYRRVSDVVHGLDFARTKAPGLRPRSLGASEATYPIEGGEEEETSQ